jgi:anti-sigma-K factor RskA
MKLTQNPELLDRLAAAYALGTLRGGARRRFESLARQSPTIRAAVLIWQERFASMTELQPAQTPDPNVWKRIENMVEAERGPAVAPTDEGWLRRLGLWRGAALAGAVATVAAVAVTLNLSGKMSEQEDQLASVSQARSQLAQQNAQLAAQLQTRPEVQYVAVLADDKSAASMLVTFDPKHNTLSLKRVGGYQEAPDKSLQLWAVPPQGAAQSLGVLGAEPVVRLTAAENQVRQAPTLAITLEPKGGVPPGAPATGPVLFKGSLMQMP